MVSDRSEERMLRSGLPGGKTRSTLRPRLCPAGCEGASSRENRPRTRHLACYYGRGDVLTGIRVPVSCLYENDHRHPGIALQKSQISGHRTGPDPQTNRPHVFGERTGSLCSAHYEAKLTVGESQAPACICPAPSGRSLHAQTWRSRHHRTHL